MASRPTRPLSTTTALGSAGCAAAVADLNTLASGGVMLLWHEVGDAYVECVNLRTLIDPRAATSNSDEFAAQGV